MQYSYGIHLLWEIYFILKIIFSWASGVHSTNQSNEIRQIFKHFKLVFGKLGWIGLKLFLNIRSSWVGLIIVIKMILPIYFYSFVFLFVSHQPKQNTLLPPPSHRSANSPSSSTLNWYAVSLARPLLNWVSPPLSLLFILFFSVYDSCLTYHIDARSALVFFFLVSEKKIKLWSNVCMLIWVQNNENAKSA
jgi:hypothetical protein